MIYFKVLWFVFTNDKVMIIGKSKNVFKIIIPTWYFVLFIKL